MDESTIDTRGHRVAPRNELNSRLRRGERGRARRDESCRRIRRTKTVPRGKMTSGGPTYRTLIARGGSRGPNHLRKRRRCTSASGTKRREGSPPSSKQCG